jgi:hypothetical protein
VYLLVSEPLGSQWNGLGPWWPSEDVEPQKPEWIAPSAWNIFKNEAKWTIASIPQIDIIDPHLQNDQHIAIHNV